jgi:translation initiation factor 1A
MPKNKGKGGKNRRRSKNENDDIKRELIPKEDGQSYAQVTRILGNGHLEVFCFDSADGKKNDYVIFVENYVKKQWINQGDISYIGSKPCLKIISADTSSHKSLVPYSI